MNYHTLSDFRVAHQAALDDLLTQSITALLQRRDRHAGARRAGWHAGPRQRRRRLVPARADAGRRVCAGAQAGRAHGAASGRGRGAARRPRNAARRASALARVEEALAQLPAIEAVKARQKRGKGRSEPRVSTTDPDARVMKMADGGFRPAYNVQFATDVDEPRDGRGARSPMWERSAAVAADAGRNSRHAPAGLPTELIDGGYVQRET